MVNGSMEDTKITQPPATARQYAFQALSSSRARFSRVRLSLMVATI